jgi:hypothetical protein
MDNALTFPEATLKSVDRTHDQGQSWVLPMLPRMRSRFILVSKKHPLFLPNLACMKPRNPLMRTEHMRPKVPERGRNDRNTRQRHGEGIGLHDRCSGSQASAFQHRQVKGDRSEMVIAYNNRLLDDLRTDVGATAVPIGLCTSCQQWVFFLHSSGMGSALAPGARPRQFKALSYHVPPGRANYISS